MTFFQILLEAFESLTINKLRSTLTSLGIVIGVAAVISLLAVGRGAENTIKESVEVIGTNLIFIFPGGLEDVTNVHPLTLEDAATIANRFSGDSISGVAPVLSGSIEVSNAGKTIVTQIRGVTPAFGPVRNFRVSEGTFITDVHLLGNASVVLLGADVAYKLFGRNEGLVGETIRISGQPFRVMGILAVKGGASVISEDDIILVPLTTAQLRLLPRPDQNQIDLIVIRAATSGKIPVLIEEISRLIRSRHQTRPGADDFTIRTQQEFLTTFEVITQVLTVLLGGIAAISLLVGGIGIMNIMLMAVTERTREIGLRKALGARKQDILLQILTESLLLSLLGGFVGTGLGAVLSNAIGRIAAVNNAEIQPVITIDIILLATLFSAGVGLFFGLYPANIAANLEPVEALRHE